MKQNATYLQIVENLTKVFNSKEETAVYNSNSHQREGFCGWCGVMAPISRPAYVEDFGAETVAKAEQEARARLAENERQYQESRHAAHVVEALKAEQDGNTAPVLGAFVYGTQSGLKCDSGDGLYQELRHVVEDPEWMKDRRPALCHVAKVYEVSGTEFDIRQLADNIVRNATQDGGHFPGGAGIDEEDKERRDLFDEYRYYYIECAAIVCKASGRWFLIDSSGYDYPRYIMLPTSWRTMYAEEVAEIERKEQERKDAEAKAEAEAKAQRLTAYTEKCKQWAGIMQDVRPLVEAEAKASKEYGWRSKEYKTAARALGAARRNNVLTMVRRYFPGLKVSVTKSDHWGGTYDVTFIDGPTLETFGKFTAFDLFTHTVEYFDGYTDSTEFHEKEFTEFAQKYMGKEYGHIYTHREQSNESRAELLAIVKEVAGISDYEPHTWSNETLKAIADRAGIEAAALINEINNEPRIRAAFVARIVFDLKDYTQPTTEPTAPKGKDGKKQPTERTKAAKGTDTKAKAGEAITDGDAAPASGLQLVEIVGGVAVIGNDWKDTYFNKRQIKAHGCHWNENAKQWEATEADTIEQVRGWFAMREQATAA